MVVVHLASASVVVEVLVHLASSLVVVGVVARTQMLPGDLWVQVKQVEVFFASRFCGPYLSLLLQWNSVFVEVVVVIEASCVWLHLRK